MTRHSEMDGGFSSRQQATRNIPGKATRQLYPRSLGPENGGSRGQIWGLPSCLGLAQGRLRSTQVKAALA